MTSPETPQFFPETKKTPTIDPLVNPSFELLNYGLVQAINEFNEGQQTPEGVTSLFQEIWKARGEKLGIQPSIPPCDRTEEELIELINNGRRIGYLPEQLSSVFNAPLLDRLYPSLGVKQIGNVDLTVNLFKNSGAVNMELFKQPILTWLFAAEVAKQIPHNLENRFGWIDYEADISAPNSGLKLTELDSTFNQEGYVGMNLNEYLIAGIDSRLFTGKFLDQGDNFTISILLGTRWPILKGNIPLPQESSVFAPMVSINTRDELVLYPGNWKEPRVGGRSVGYKNVQTLKEK